MGIKIISENRQARFNYELLETFEAGLVLHGSEVKSLRDGRAHLNDAYASLKGGEVFLLRSHIAPYQAMHYAVHEPYRTRKLLLHQEEVNKLIGKVQEKGFTLIPLKLYFKNGLAKVELALAKSKTKGDKRETIRRREEKKVIARAIKQSLR